MVILTSVPINCEFRVLYYFYTAFEDLDVTSDFYRYTFPTILHFLMFLSLHFTFTQTLFFQHFLSLLKLNVAVHSSVSKTLVSLRHRRSELLSLRSHRLQNRDVISAIKRFDICAHRIRRRTQRGDRRKQHAIKVIDTGLRTSTCSYTRMVRRNLINLHSISNGT